MHNIANVGGYWKNSRLEPDTENCSICQDDLIANPTENVLLNCNHVYHQKCIEAYIKSALAKHEQPVCPKCRSVLTTTQTFGADGMPDPTGTTPVAQPAPVDYNNMPAQILAQLLNHITAGNPETLGPMLLPPCTGCGQMRPRCMQDCPFATVLPGTRLEFARLVRMMRGCENNLWDELEDPADTFSCFGDDLSEIETEVPDAATMPADCTQPDCACQCFCARSPRRAAFIQIIRPFKSAHSRCMRCFGV
jgi:hypothetical protein